MIRKVLDELRLEKKEEKEWKLKFLTAKNRLFKNLSDYEEEKKAIEMTRKIMKEIDIVQKHSGRGIPTLNHNFAHEIFLFCKTLMMKILMVFRLARRQKKISGSCSDPRLQKNVIKSEHSG